MSKQKKEKKAVAKKGGSETEHKNEREKNI